MFLGHVVVLVAFLSLLSLWSWVAGGQESLISWSELVKHNFLLIDWLIEPWNPFISKPILELRVIFIGLLFQGPCCMGVWGSQNGQGFAIGSNLTSVPSSYPWRSVRSRRFFCLMVSSTWTFSWAMKTIRSRREMLTHECQSSRVHEGCSA